MSLIGHKPKYLKALFGYFLSIAFIFRKKIFHWNNSYFFYFNHRYNLTFLNERTIEIPLAISALNSYSGKGLEIGNVLGHYLTSPKIISIVDKYENNLSHVLNHDILTYTPKTKFDFVISVSTMEHVGQDENEPPEKAIKVMERLRDLLSPYGKIFITFPLGYNKSLDTWIFQKNYFTSVSFLKRKSWRNEWVPISQDDAKGARFNDPYPLANIVCICEYESVQ